MGDAMTNASRAKMLKQEIVEALRRNVEHVALFQSAVAVRLGLSAADNKCLQILLRQGAQSAGELAEQVGLTTGAITGVVDRLERLGYVTREPNPNDRRVVMVAPVYEKAGVATDAVFEGIKSRTSEFVRGHSNSQLAMILEFLIQIDEIFDQETQTLRFEAVPSA
jgi:DNA-binding MarR family transcriptional regulator